MYIKEFLKRMTRKSNLPLLVYLIINVVFITEMIYFTIGDYVPYWESLMIGLALYAISISIALSPLGEWILRLQTGCKEITRVEYSEFIGPIFKEVYEKAKALDPTIPDDVHLYMNADEDANAFATGRKTICITEGLMHKPANQIKATLAHEFGHLAHKDTDLILFVSVGNLIVSALILVVRVIIFISYLFGAVVAAFFGGPQGAVGSIMNAVIHLMETLFITGLMWVWTKLGVILVMKTSRENEYEADEFSYNLGYGNDLCALLEKIGDVHANGLFANLASSHPDKNERIGRLQKLGATYRAERRLEV